LNQLKAKYGSKRPVSVFYQISERPLMTLGGRQFVSDAIELCGGHNVFADSPVMAPQVNIEAVLAADPEAIITASVRPRTARGRRCGAAFRACARCAPRTSTRCR
jgi:vitamin B12 transport system substrate-binding protein